MEKKNLKPFLLITVLLFTFVLLPQAVFGVPPLPNLFYGQVTNQGEPAPVGTVIIAKAGSEERGRIKILESGVYGGPLASNPKLLVQGEIAGGAEIKFFISNHQAQETANFQSGGITQLNLHFSFENITVSSADLPALLDDDSLDPTGTATSTSQLNVTQDLVINVSVGGGTSTVGLPQGTVITQTGGGNFDATDLTAGTVSPDTLSGLGTGSVVEGNLQWGLPNIELQFSQPINLSIFVGTDLNGQTLNIQRSTSGGGGWTSDGISPITCLVTNGYCNFTATKASYFAVYTPPPPPPTPTPTPTPNPTPSPAPTGDTTAPSMSAVNAVTGATTTTITWQTNEASISWLVYGTTTTYGKEAKTTTYITSHSVSLTGLSPATTYHYQIKSKDALGNIDSYIDKTFITLALGVKITGDINNNNKVDIFDFNTLMVNWGNSPANLAADLDGNGKIDIFDFNLLMVNWTG